MKTKEIEKIIMKAGWVYKDTKGSHKHFVHPYLPGKITIPQHRGDVSLETAKSIFAMAKIKEPKK